MKVLTSRGIQPDFGIVEIGGEPWQVFEYQTRCIAIDPNSGLWVGPHGGEWTCVSRTCTVSSILEALDTLTLSQPA